MMQALPLPRMFVSDRQGWTELFERPPAVLWVFLNRVLPLSMLPPLMCAYSAHRHPGVVLPAIAPGVQRLALGLVGGVTIALEIALIHLMASQVRLLADAPSDPFGRAIDDRAAYSFAAIAPVPLWLSSLALFVPSRFALVAAVLVGWIGSAALIRHGVSELYHTRNRGHARSLARAVLSRAVFSWMVVVLALIGSWLALSQLR